MCDVGGMSKWSITSPAAAQLNEQYIKPAIQTLADASRRTDKKLNPYVARLAMEETYKRHHGDGIDINEIPALGIEEKGAFAAGLLFPPIFNKIEEFSRCEGDQRLDALKGLENCLQGVAHLLEGAERGESRALDVLNSVVNKTDSQPSAFEHFLDKFHPVSSG